MTTRKRHLLWRHSDLPGGRSPAGLAGSTPPPGASRGRGLPPPLRGSLGRGTRDFRVPGAPASSPPPRARGLGLYNSEFSLASDCMYHFEKHHVRCHRIGCYPPLRSSHDSASGEERWVGACDSVYFRRLGPPGTRVRSVNALFTLCPTAWARDRRFLGTPCPLKFDSISPGYGAPLGFTDGSACEARRVRPHACRSCVRSVPCERQRLREQACACG